MDSKFGYITVNLANVKIDIFEDNWYYSQIGVTGIPNGAKLISCIKAGYNANVMIGVGSDCIILQSPVKVTLPPQNRYVVAVWAKI